MQLQKDLEHVGHCCNGTGLPNHPLAPKMPCYCSGVGNGLPQDQNPGEVKDYYFFGLVHVISHQNLDVISQSPNL